VPGVSEEQPLLRFSLVECVNVTKLSEILIVGFDPRTATVNTRYFDNQTLLQ
jgi:hypothetical protein